MATLIHTDGTRREVKPSGKKFTLSELQHHVGGQIELVPALVDGKKRNMYVNEEGRFQNLPYNKAATALLPNHYIVAGNYVVGPALVADKGEG